MCGAAARRIDSVQGFNFLAWTGFSMVMIFRLRPLPISIPIMFPFGRGIPGAKNEQISVPRERSSRAPMAC